MKTLFNHDYMRANQGCYSETKGKLEQCSFMSKQEISINDILDSEIPLKHKAWFVINKCELTLDEKKLLALNCAKSVVSIYNAKYPNDTRVSDCIAAIELFREGKITREELLTARAADAAYAAAAAAYAAAAAAAAYAAAAAAYAADAAYAAAAAAADAAYAADAYAYAYAADAADAAAANKLLTVLKDFVK